MKNSNLISTVIYAQVLLIFISFKIPEKLTDKGLESPMKKEMLVSNKISTITENVDMGEASGITYNLNYPSITNFENTAHVAFNTLVAEKISQSKFKIGFGDLTTQKCQMLVDSKLITNQYSDFKLYKKTDYFVSVLLLKADYLSNHSYPEYSFHTINYSLNDTSILGFDDIFSSNSKELFVTLLNSKLNKLGNCKPITAAAFETYKNNFVITDDNIKFYFDECMMCDDHHREYAIEIPLSKIRKNSIISDILI